MTPLELARSGEDLLTMNQESANSVLHRLLRTATEAAREPVTSARALRLAMARSAERSVGLTLTVISVTEESMPLDALLAQIDPACMLLSVGADDHLVGFACLDLQARTAVVEVQTLGVLRTSAAADRPITPSDAALCAPFVARFLSDFAVTSDGTPLSGWTEGLAAGARFQDARAAGMVLPECEMRLVRLSLDLATGERQGQLALALPVRRTPANTERAGPGPRFADQFRKNVMSAPAQLSAVLHRMQMPIARVERFEIGQIVPLPGITVRSVRLEGPDGIAVAEGRLGQITGMRAVRIEKRGAAELRDVRMSSAAHSAAGQGGANGTPSGATGPRGGMLGMGNKSMFGAGMGPEMNPETDRDPATGFAAMMDEPAGETGGGGEDGMEFGGTDGADRARDHGSGMAGSDKPGSGDS